MRNRHPRKRKSTKHYNRPSVDEVLGLAAGHWLEILQDAGVPSDALEGKRGRPCPQCGGRDRFAPLPNIAERGAVLCRHCFTRGTDPAPGDGVATLRWWLGVGPAEALRWLSDWLGLSLAGYWIRPRPVVRSPVQPKSEPDDEPADDRFAKLANECHDAMPKAWRRRAAELLGLSVEPLERLAVGWSGEHRATTWPMRNASGDVIGIRLRCPKTGRKWAVMGSKAGLIFSPDLLRAERLRRLWIPEGPSDTAAMLSVGLAAAGVPSAGGKRDLAANLCRSLRPAEAIVVADADGPGRDGAERLADELAVVCPVRVLSPCDGANDPREWTCGGADAAAIEAAADAVELRTLREGSEVTR